MRKILLAAAFFTAMQMPAQVSYEAEMKPLLDGFSKSCPAKNLQYFTPGDLNYQIEKFEPSMTPTQDQAFKHAAEVRCKGSAGGVSCVNLGFIDAGKGNGVLDQFVRSLCGQPISCKAPGKCAGR